MKMQTKKIVLMVLAVLLVAGSPLFAKGYTSVVKIKGKAIVEEGKLPVVKVKGETVVLMVPPCADQPEGEDSPTPMIKNGDTVEAEGFYLPSQVAGLDIKMFHPEELTVNGETVKMAKRPQRRKDSKMRSQGRGQDAESRDGSGKKDQKGNNRSKMSKGKGSQDRGQNGMGRLGKDVEPVKVELTGKVTVEEYKDVLLKTTDGLHVLMFEWKALPESFALKSGDTITVKGFSKEMPISGMEIKMVDVNSLTKGEKTIILTKKDSKGSKRGGFFGKPDDKRRDGKGRE